MTMIASHEPLFLSGKSVDDLFPVKIAAAISRVPDDEKKWPQFVFSELLREMPFLSTYDVDIVLDKLDPEAGAGLGYAQVRNKTMSRPQDNVSSPGNIIRIPIIISERRLQKFYIFECGKQTYPLTEDRVQQALLNPSVFDTDVSRVPASGSLIEQIFPPYQQRQGFGRVTEPSAMGLSKLSSAPRSEKIAAILEALDARTAWRNATETEKLAFAFGSKHSAKDPVGSAHMSPQDRQHAVATSGARKTETDPSTRWRSILAGAARTAPVNAPVSAPQTPANAQDQDAKSEAKIDKLIEKEQAQRHKMERALLDHVTSRKEVEPAPDAEAEKAAGIEKEAGAQRLLRLKAAVDKAGPGASNALRDAADRASSKFDRRVWREAPAASAERAKNGLKYLVRSGGSPFDNTWEQAAKAIKKDKPLLSRILSKAT